MNRTEALNILGLDEDATDKDIKSAYRECVQILHPDRFANNKRLADRATEQFKRLQDAYDYLTSAKARKEDARRSQGGASGAAYANASAWSPTEARLAGLAAARTQLVAQRDALLDERRNALVMVVAGAVLAVFLRRVVWIAGLAGTFIIWGVVKLIGTIQSLSTIDDHLKEIDQQRREIEEEEEE